MAGSDPPIRPDSEAPSQPAPALRGRGAAENPHNRFERIAFEPEPDPDACDPEAGDAPPPRTILLRDPSRSIVSRNQSPDIGFEASVNPYRGCEHGCVYCLGPDTPVLHADMTWGPIGNLRLGDVLVGFDERARAGRPRKLRPAVVEAIWWSRRPTLRMITRESDIITTPEHLWLQARDFRWSRTEQLLPGRCLRRLPVVPIESIDDDYRAGYIAGMSLGDGTFRYEPGWRSSRQGFPAAYWRVALVDREPLELLVQFLARFGIDVEIRGFSGRPAASLQKRPMWKVETRALGKLELIHRLLGSERDQRNYRRGFLSGFFDAEGHNGTSLRLSQKDTSVLERVRLYGVSLGFEFRMEPREGRASTLRLVGSIAERMRFFGTVSPVIRRKRERLFERMPPTLPEPVEKVEPGRVEDVVDIQTSTGTFYAAGLATHNCYARPTHEYLGFSAGLDFETKILVKQQAPALLRAELGSPRWEPRVLAFSGVTDCYQPAERKLRITRGCLEVLAEFRNPTTVVTKSALVERDADLLGELARHDAASVALSVTTLDAALHRVLEPRAPRPERRLAAIRALAGAGVPVGVLVAPVIPGLNDHEIPRILEAAAAAGARFASWVLLRLPHGLGPLFDAWLARHRPERRERVLARIRETRGGRLYDPRFGTRGRGEGVYAGQLATLFRVAARRYGLDAPQPPLSTTAFRRPSVPQLGLFDSFR